MTPAKPRQRGSEMKLSERLTIHAQDCALASRDNNDMVIGFHQMNDLAVALAEAAQLARRVEEAPSGEVWQHMVAAGQRTSSVILTREPEDGLAIIGQRVRLVREA